MTKKVSLILALILAGGSVLSSDNSEASTVTFKWLPYTSLDIPNGWLTLEVPSLTVPNGSWSNASGDVKVLEFKFGTLVFSPPASPLIPLTLRSNGYSLFSGSSFDLNIAYRVDLAFQQAPGWDLVDTGGIKINQGRWTWSSATISPIPEPQIYAMLLAGIGVLGLKLNRRSCGSSPREVG